MRRRHWRLKAQIEAIGGNPRSRSVENRRLVQGGFFLAKIERMDETQEDGFSVQTQTGYFYKWYGGPTSTSLSDKFRQLPGHLRFMNVSRFEPREPSEFPRHQRAGLACEYGPRKLVENGLWARTLATLAYLKRAGWSDEGMAEEVADNLGPEPRKYVDHGFRVLRQFEYIR